MNESAPRTPEQHRTPIMDPEHVLPTAEQAEPLRPGEADPLKQAEQARATVEQVAESAKGNKNPVEKLQEAERAAEPTQPAFINRELKAITLRRELQTIRRQLPAPERVLSRIIHQPAVRAVSETAGKTVSRPSGLLGGGLVALLGTTGYLYMAQHMGFRYNYFIFLALFAGGFAFGLILELLVWAFTRSRRAAD